MSKPMVRLLCAVAIASACGAAHARVLTARIAKIATPVATLHGVQVQVDWPDAAPQGTLRLRAQHVEAPDLGYGFRELDWQCPLLRDGQGGWQCTGDVRSGRAKPLRLEVKLGIATTDATLGRGASKLALHRDAAAPDLSRLDLVRVPLAWTQALLAQSWPDAHITGGELDGRLVIAAPANQPLQVSGPLHLRGGAFDTPDGTIAAESLDAQLDMNLAFAHEDRVRVDGAIHGGELLFGSAYVSLQQRTVALHLDAAHSEGEGWRLPQFAWRDPGLLVAEGSAALTAEATVDALDVQLQSPDLAPLRDGYLSGWLGMAGMSDLRLSGSADARLQMAHGSVRKLEVDLERASIEDPQQRFDFSALDGSVRFSADTATTSDLQWDGGALYGLTFGPAQLPFASSAGELRFRQAVDVPMLGGRLRFDHMRLRPPGNGQGLDVTFGLNVQNLDVAQLAKALQWPAFTGQLTGAIPQAHYAAERLDFEGDLQMQIFDGKVTVSALAMERPFGVAPTLSADIALDDLDLESLTGVFGFGSITGRLDGRIGALRMVDWQAVAFDADLHTQRKPGVKQRISQRAVQDLSSVGDASFVTSLQSRLIGLFDDFGYARIGIACRLADDVCRMDGLGSAGQGFIIVEGSGVPRLSVVGFNRLVDWPTLVERLGAIGAGDVKPVVE